MSGGDIVYGGTYANGIVLSNPATQNPATIAATGLVTNNGTALYGQPVAAWNVSNFGTVEAISALNASGTGYGIVLAAGGSITNAGLITGSLGAIVIGGTAGGSVTNNAGGTINSNVTLANGGSVTNSAGGTISSSVTFAHDAGTVANSGSIDALNLNAGGGVTNGGGGTIGTVFIVNSPGSVANSGSIPGGVFLDAGGSVENTSGGTISGRVLGSFGHVTPAISISGGAGTVTNSGIIDDNIGVSSGAGVIVNSGSISGRILLDAGGSVTNALIGSEDGISISGDAGTVANSGLIKGSVNLDAGGTVTNLGVIRVVSGNFGGYPGVHDAVALYASGTLTNLGTIEAGNLKTGPGSVGVALAAGGTVGNGASDSPLALISGSYFGILGYGSSTVANFGSISATGSYGTGVYLGSGGTMTNSGIITGYEYGAALLGGAGALVNDGAISATGSAGVGVTLGGDNSTLANAGYIAGAGGTAVSLAGSYNDLVVQPGAVFVGKVAAAGSYNTLELAGSRGRLAGLGTRFSGFYNLVVDPGALWNLSGPGRALAVDNDGTLVAKGDTLSLGRVLSDAGYTGVIRITTDGTAAFAGAVGAHEQVAFTDDTGTMRLDHPLNFKGAITGFRAGDTIDLVNHAADGINFSDNRLAVTDNGAKIADLHLFGSFAAADFALSPDGHGGTDITLLPPLTFAMKG